MILHMALGFFCLFLFCFVLFSRILLSLVPLALHSLLLHLHHHHQHYPPHPHLFKQISFKNHTNNYLLPCIITRALSGNSAMMKVSSAVLPPPVNNNRVSLSSTVHIFPDMHCTGTCSFLSFRMSGRVQAVWAVVRMPYIWWQLIWKKWAFFLSNDLQYCFCFYLFLFVPKHWSLFISFIHNLQILNKLVVHPYPRGAEDRLWSWMGLFSCCFRVFQEVQQYLVINSDFVVAGEGSNPHQRSTGDRIRYSQAVWTVLMVIIVVL